MFNFLSKSHKPDPYRQRMAYCPPPMPSEMTRDVHKTLARLFATEDGRKVLAWLQLTTFQKALGPDAPDCAFYYMEGQRALVANILRLIERGRQIR